MEEKVNELCNKIILLENRVNELEKNNRRMKINKIVTTIIMIVFAIIIAIVYINLISKIYGNYTNML